MLLRTAALVTVLAVPTVAQKTTKHLSSLAGMQRVKTQLVRLDDTGPEGYAELHFDRSTYDAFRDAHETGNAALFDDLPLPGGESVNLVLRPIDVWEEGGTAIARHADGSEERIVPSVRMFATYVPGRASRGFLAISPRMVHGYLAIDGVNHFLSTGTAEADRLPLLVSHENAFEVIDGLESDPAGHSHSNHSNHEHENETCEDPTSPGWCHANEELFSGGPTLSSTGPRRLPAPEIRRAKIFIEADKRVRNRFATAQDCVDYCTLLVGAMSTIYHRDIGVDLVLPSGYVRVSDGVSDPWEGYPGSYPAWFNSTSNPLYPVERALSNKLTGFGRGSSASGLLCDDAASFAYSEVKGFFPYPIKHTSANNWDLYAFGMESGHIFGSAHTQNYSPPIACNDGSGPDEGTLMSYCAFPGTLWQPTMAEPEKIGMRFHERVQAHITSFVKRTTCPTLVTVGYGDYDANGVIDMADLGEFDAHLVQGFYSSYATSVFDMNQDGLVDALDRGILVASMIAPATSSVHNGNGSNCLCYGTVTQPILGQTWKTVVGNYVGNPILTVVAVGTSRLAPPIATPHGEVLVNVQGFGGATIFASLAMTNGVYALHENPIPYDPSFAGTTLESQAALCKPTGLELTNALTLNVSTY